MAGRAKRLAEQTNPPKQPKKTRVKKILKKAQQKRTFSGNNSQGLLNRLDKAHGKKNLPNLKFKDKNLFNPL